MCAFGDYFTVPLILTSRLVSKTFKVINPSAQLSQHLLSAALATE